MNINGHGKFPDDVSAKSWEAQFPPFTRPPMESFRGKLKTEWLYGKRFRTWEEAKQAVFEYIELFYKRKRRCSVNGYIPPLKIGFAAQDENLGWGVIGVHKSWAWSDGWYKSYEVYFDGLGKN